MYQENKLNPICDFSVAMVLDRTVRGITSEETSTERMDAVESEQKERRIAIKCILKGP